MFTCIFTTSRAHSGSIEEIQCKDHKYIEESIRSKRQNSEKCDRFLTKEIRPLSARCERYCLISVLWVNCHTLLEMNYFHKLNPDLSSQSTHTPFWFMDRDRVHTVRYKGCLHYASGFHGTDSRLQVDSLSRGIHFRARNKLSTCLVSLRVGPGSFKRVDLPSMSGWEFGGAPRCSQQGGKAHLFEASHNITTPGPTLMFCKARSCFQSFTATDVSVDLLSSAD